jgi:serine phosphatase RsbU (regulator of sigma subunit)
MAGPAIYPDMDADPRARPDPAPAPPAALEGDLMDDLAAWFRRATGWGLTFGGPDGPAGSEAIALDLPAGWDERLILEPPAAGRAVAPRHARRLARTIAVLLQRFVRAEARLRELEAREQADQATLQADIAQAAKLQAGFAPRIASGHPALDLAAWSRPCRAVGGDFHDLIALADENLGIAIGDACGKGIAAALIMALVRGGLHAHVENVYRVSDIMARLNATLSASTPGDHFMSLFYGVLDLRHRTFSFTNAGHNPPLLWRRGEFRELNEGGLVLGIAPDVAYDEMSLPLQEGDLVVLYTDGVTEAADAAGRFFGVDRLRAAIAAARDLPAAGVLATIRDQLDAFAAPGSQSDDLTLLAFRGPS